jgi:hypothetical protein
MILLFLHEPVGTVLGINPDIEKVKRIVKVVVDPFSEGFSEFIWFFCV